MEIMRQRHGAMSESEADELREAAKRPIDSDPLYIQLQERYERLDADYHRAIDKANDRYQQIAKLQEAMTVLLNSQKEATLDFTFKKYTESRLAAQGPVHSAEQKLGAAVMGLAGESGEVVSAMLGLSVGSSLITDHVKKYFYHGKDLDKELIIKELGDVLWYVMYLADAIGSSLETVALENELKLSRRYPNGFSVEAARQVRMQKEVKEAFDMAATWESEK